MSSVPVTRSDVRLEPDLTRVILRAFLPGGHDQTDDRTRVERILDRVLSMPDEDVARTLDDVHARFADRHGALQSRLERSYETVAHLVSGPSDLSPQTRDLVGAYFLHEYALEAAALTNPSMVADPDQSGVDDGWLRIVVSLRAIGEGHISSIEFRTGLVGPDGQVQVEPPLPAAHGQRREPTFDRDAFGARLAELEVTDDQVGQVLGTLGEQFSMADLMAALRRITDRAGDSPDVKHTVRTVHWLAASNYELTFPADSALSQRVIFPAGPAESHGMEDARFVRFRNDGAVTYYATYTAYDGYHVLPQLIETRDFVTFRIATLSGSAARNKGMALFPRKVGGRYAALGRADNENNYVMLSDHVRSWQDCDLVQLPTRPWELIQIGNCGPPIETPQGWLVLTHGVGAMRTYALGAVLLDLEDPRRVLGHLRDPLLLPNQRERDGYVPNVVYSCGALVHGDRLVLAYGASDRATCFATVPMEALLTELTRSGAGSPRPPTAQPVQA